MTLVISSGLEVGMTFNCSSQLTNSCILPLHPLFSFFTKSVSDQLYFHFIEHIGVALFFHLFLLGWVSHLNRKLRVDHGSAPTPTL